MFLRVRTAAVLVAAFFSVLLTSAQNAAHAASQHEFARAFVIEIDGVRRGENAAQQALPPASLTKMMTGLLVIERATPDASLLISPHAASATGSKLGLRAGDRMRASDLLSAMLIASANDACRALAEWVAGSEPAFVVLMNQRAQAMGLSNTHFVNACGHDAEGHLSTANDLATLARAAMALPEYARRARIPALRITTLDERRRFTLKNHNHLIGRFAGAYGVKTGFTAKAGKCLVAMAERKGHHVLLVMLNAKNRWWDADAALNYALNRAESIN